MRKRAALLPFSFRAEIASDQQAAAASRVALPGAVLSISARALVGPGRLLHIEHRRTIAVVQFDSLIW